MSAFEANPGHRLFGFGIIGAGNIAKVHADAINRLPNARLIAISSRSKNKAKELAQKYGAKSYPNFDTLISDSAIDVVCICTPSGAHRDLAIAAAQAGRHVIVEKPLEVTIKRAQEIIDAADAAGVKLGTIFNTRFSDANQRLKQAVDSGNLGKLLQGDAYIKWYRSQKYYDSSEWRGTWVLDGGGALMNQGIHLVDRLLWIMGPVDEVFAYAATQNHEHIEVEDTLVAVLRFRNGALGTISAATSLYPGQPTVFEVHGDMGTVRIRDDNIVAWQLASLTEEQQADIINSTSSKVYGTFADPTSMSSENHRRQLENFLQAIEIGSDSLVGGSEGLRSVRIVEAIYRSAELGKPVSLDAELGGV